MDYYREFLEKTELLLDDFLKRNETKLYVGRVSMRKAVKNYLWSFLILGGYREFYNCGRKEGIDSQILERQLCRELSDRFEMVVENKKISLNDGRYEAFEVLKSYVDSVVVLCKNSRQMGYWCPIVSKLTSPVLMLCNYECEEEEDESELGDHVAIVELSVLHEKFIQNDYLEKCFPCVFAYANLFTMIMDIVTPSCVMVMEGCHEEAEVLAAIAKSMGVESVCYQQGWPSVMHTRFCNMGYDRFMTWGKVLINCGSRIIRQ